MEKENKNYNWEQWGVGGRIPDAFYEIIREYENRTHLFVAFREGGLTEFYVLLDNVSETERETFTKGTLIVSAYENDEVAILTVATRDAGSYDAPIPPYKGDIEEIGNALNLYLIDTADMTLQALRVLGLNREIHDMIKSGCRKAEGAEVLEITQRAEKVFGRFSPAELLELGAKQLFKRTTRKKGN